MMSYEGSESARKEKFGEFVYQFKPEIRTHVRKLERIIVKLYRHVSISFKQTYSNEKNADLYIYIYVHFFFLSISTLIHFKVFISIYLPLNLFNTVPIFINPSMCSFLTNCFPTQFQKLIRICRITVGYESM